MVNMHDEPVCGGQRCSKREKCASYGSNYWKTHDNSIWAQSIDWSNYGWGHVYETKDGKQVYESGYDCGDLSENYPLFKPVVEVGYDI